MKNNGAELLGNLRGVRCEGMGTSGKFRSGERAVLAAESKKVIPAGRSLGGCGCGGDALVFSMQSRLKREKPMRGPWRWVLWQELLVGAAHCRSWPTE